MKTRLLLLCLVALFASCIYDPGNDDITIINHTPDSLYCYVHGYKRLNDYNYNFSFDSTAASTNRKYDYDVAYNINIRKIYKYLIIRKYLEFVTEIMGKNLL